MVFIYDMCAKIANYCRLASFYNKKFEKKIKIIAISYIGRGISRGVLRFFCAFSTEKLAD